MAGVVTAIAVAVMLVSFARGVISRGFLASMGLFYVLFAVVLLVLHVR